jgi:hypothetical protein
MRKPEGDPDVVAFHRLTGRLIEAIRTRNEVDLRLSLLKTSKWML